MIEPTVCIHERVSKLLKDVLLEDGLYGGKKLHVYDTVVPGCTARLWHTLEERHGHDTVVLGSTVKLWSVLKVMMGA